VIETHGHEGDFKELVQSETARHGPMIRYIRPDDRGLQRKHFIVRADELLTAFVELEAAA
jgi:hypothetical protein